MKNNKTTITVNRDTLELIQILRKKQTIYDYVADMARYFYATKIHPSEFANTPLSTYSLQFTNQMNRIVKILRDQETLFVNSFENILSGLNQDEGKDSLTNSESKRYVPVLKTTSGEITAEDFANVYTNLKQLEQQKLSLEGKNKNYEREISRLNQELTKQQNTSLSADYVISILNEFSRNAKEDRIDRRSMYMNKADFNKIILKIQEEVIRIKNINSEKNEE